MPSIRTLFACLLAAASSALAADAPQNGLAAQYFNGMNFDRLKNSRIETNFDLVRKDKVFPPPGIEWDRWSVRWTGHITPSQSETYTFYATADDGCRLWIDGRQIINDWISHPAKEVSGQAPLIAGRQHQIVFEYFNGTGGAAVRLEWQSPGQPRQVIPASALSPTAPSNMPPRVSLLSPAHLSSHREGEPVPVQVEAADDERVTKVELYSDGQLVHSDTEAPYSYHWSAASDGEYRIKVRAYDSQGAYSESPEIETHVYHIAAPPKQFVIGVWGQPTRDAGHSPAFTPADWKALGINTMVGYDWGPQHNTRIEDWLEVVGAQQLSTVRQWRNAWKLNGSYQPGDQVQHLERELNAAYPKRDIADRQWTCIQAHTSSPESEPGTGASAATCWAESPKTQGRFISSRIVDLATDNSEPSLSAWMQSDEPDLNDSPTPEQIAPLYQMLKRIAPERPVYINFAGPRLHNATRKAIYLDYIHHADWIGEDSYPINNLKPLSIIAERQDLLRQYSAGKPQFCFIECSWQHLRGRDGKPQGRCPTACEMRAQIWLSIIHGAVGIIYFPQRVDGQFRYNGIPSDSRDPDNPKAPSGGDEFDLKAMMRKQHQLLAEHSPWLVDPSSAKVLTDLPTGLEGIERTHAGETRRYLLNSTETPITYQDRTIPRYDILILEAPKNPER